MNVLVTGGAGYIGSHAVQRLLREGHHVTVLDNLYRGHRRAMDLLGDTAKGRLAFIEADVCDRGAVRSAVLDHKVETVMHFAAVAYVGESVEDPLRYYRWNVDGLLSVLEACTAGSVPRLVFSSSCSTYGQPPDHLIPIPEHCPQDPVSPYGRTKLMGEHIIRDYAESRRLAGKPFGYALLRYFNVAGCDRTGLLGEDHTPESHLVPVVLQVALGQRSSIGIFGTDYPTPDGTCIRDYVHVEDLADAHVLAMQKLQPGDGLFYNVGIGRGYSVREIIASARRVTGHPIPVVEQPRRAGDPPRAFADPAKITRELGWKAQVTDLDDIIASAWKWMSRHPKGYRS
ncbi:MAG TPA: UDP-glucose 4-epimerase GalE [Phycisphaerales bacterium]|nr:UDP-glucose 4-epimerase GalE [Phycisphaerales bacterium]